ncbi:MAG: zinc-ribbon domain-containing protein [Muribaculaceae bacterium]|nr:zinc-ribbon domain-containing protein [Muribaculaceae bacterium]
MELQCPQCGKWMAVSLEELVMHDSQVVCPQCLAVCLYQNGKLEARDDSDAPYRHTATVDSTTKHDSSNYCHSCGKHLPAGISFCPYCGADLAAPFDKKEAPAPKAPVQEPVQEAKPQPVREKPQPAARKQQAAERPREAANHVEEKLRTVSRHYTSVHPRLHQNGTMPGTAFKVIAYIIIALLLALLVFIIIAGNSLEPTM